MTVYAVCRTGKGANTFVAHPDVKAARNSGNGFHIVKAKKDLSDKRIFPTSFLVDIYNKNVSKNITKFRDRATAEKKVFDLFRSVAATSTEEVKEPVVEDTPKIKGRPTKMTGQCFKATLKHNPRREGTISHKWYALVLKKPGISYEDLQKHYGSEDFTRHLRHDLKLGRIEMAGGGQ